MFYSIQSTGQGILSLSKAVSLILDHGLKTDFEVFYLGLGLATFGLALVASGLSLDPVLRVRSLSFKADLKDHASDNFLVKCN